MRQVRALVVAMLLVLPLACSVSASGDQRALSDEEPISDRIVITTGTTAGVYYAWGLALRDQLREAHPSLDVEVVPSSGSIENLQRLSDGTADLAVSAGDAAERTASENETESGSVPLRAVARIYDDYYHLIVPRGSTLRSVDDLAGHRVAIGDPGSGTALIARRLLGLAEVGVKEKELGIVDGLQALEKGEVDAVFWSGGVPTTAVEDASERMPLRLLGLGDLARRMRAEFGAVYRPAAIPPGRYGIGEQVDTLALANLLVVRADADDELVTAVTSTIFDHRAAIAERVPAANQTDRRSAIFTGGLPLHPAAEAYYRKAKL
ncbi:TAXI family TRAP transporter solute-binding subunit [Kineosporia succinea]|uniref:TRAP transporter TAXI family solute receptor n=1 Tax=Kineosporia succinea TaxID=84632 RepID=A0ABT9NW26_9ACTN|nr:TAXI family TRAP transporter solute-binding subunit [Kineosporia succinea]MDP9824622.1 TRAP transporter TAXI family solute receptor [Kineosporia succinea]